jgi:dienelactone hydrolase
MIARVLRRRPALWFSLALVLLLVLGWTAAPYVASAAFVLDLSGSASWVRRALPVRTRAVTTRDLDVPTRYGPIPARLYQPSGRSDRSLIVFPGIHAGGIDEPRLAAFSRRLAGAGVTVASVPLPELRRYRISPVSADMIEDATIWMASNAALAPDGRVGLAGVSFAGGLALVAAGRPQLSGKIREVVVLGGHADLPRVMTFLCTGRLPDGTTRAPHDYGVAIILLAALPHLVPPEQLPAARDATLTFLDASSFDSSDRARSAAMFADARRRAQSAPEPSRTLLELLNDRNVAALGPHLLPYIEELGGASALSPDRSPAPQMPVFLLHGVEDNVIPSTETPLAAAYLRQHGNLHVSWLLTPLLSHANVRPATAADAWRLIRFWKDMLGTQ